MKNKIINNIFLLFVILTTIIFNGCENVKANELEKQQTIEFIKQNEFYGNYKNTTYFDTALSICAGLTYYLVKHKELNNYTKNKKNCRKVKYGFLRCEIEKSDYLTNKQCEKQTENHIEYIEKTITEKINNYKKKKTEKKIALIDLLYQFGETNNKIKKLLNDINNNKKSSIIINDFYDLLKIEDKKKIIYLKGYKTRMDRRIDLYFN